MARRPLSSSTPTATAVKAITTSKPGAGFSSVSPSSPTGLVVTLAEFHWSADEGEPSPSTALTAKWNVTLPEVGATQRTFQVRLSLLTEVWVASPDLICTSVALAGTASVPLVTERSKPPALEPPGVGPPPI